VASSSMVYFDGSSPAINGEMVGMVDQRKGKEHQQSDIYTYVRKLATTASKGAAETPAL